MEREGNPNPLRDQIEDFLRVGGKASIEDGEKAEEFALRIGIGETTGDHISDYIFHQFLNGLATDAEIIKKGLISDPDLYSVDEMPDLSGVLEKLLKEESNVGEIEAKLEGHIGEEIFVEGRAFGRLRRWVYKLGIVEAGKLDFTID